ncbi:glycosyltransferase family protein [Novosphingobium aerophilum]|uniref:Glycosyltransferase n=1 Tax=Novosphingobium aerophilum TaxID=2839843 RepID=A0A7X1F702_9SPHN|nr:glycosyltransferase [Novosphingobium aerophilum]MBC2651536.1 glycosyltransferase [Novosphingobium aerophilum]
MNLRAVFLLNLVQDVNILRPLVHMARESHGYTPVLLISAQFFGRDRLGIWRNEIDEICAATGASQHVYNNEFEAFEHLGGSGIIFAGSESHLPAHITTHNVFRYAPATYLRVTLQHGYECVGFRHSADHTLAHGPTATFGADLICAWFDREHLTALDLSQAGKVVVTGPSALLQMPTDSVTRAPQAPGIVCENLHSVRLRMAGNFKLEFVDAFATFCNQLAQRDQRVVLRPHPGGQYVLKNKVPLPRNALINNAPMYRLDMRQFAYGISAPSSVLVDMVLAGIPTAVWTDRDGAMDASSYAGLHTVSGPGDWLDFATSAQADPAPYLERQQLFLKRSGMPLDPADVFARYSEIFTAANRLRLANPGAARERERILFVANGNVPTLQLSFEKPLAAAVARGELVTCLITEPELRANMETGTLDAWLSTTLASFDPTQIVFCRYSGPGGAQIIDWARAEQVPVLYHIDDDLLAIPKDIGERKHALHNAPERLEAVRLLLGAADLVYVSTEALKMRLAEQVPDAQLQAGAIYCSGNVIRRPVPGPARKVGYMASADHAHNLTMIMPAIVSLLDRNPEVVFELFGSIPCPPELERFGKRISTAPPIANYEHFLQEFARLEWDIGICPLTPIPFNLMKANTKWVEYTSAGAAVVASRGGVYDECCADGAGRLAGTTEEWLEALELLVRDEGARLAQVKHAQQKLEESYSLSQLREQVLAILGDCRNRAALRAPSAHQQGMVTTDA